jgi:DNA-binding NarL/FixJ family response regulator
MTSPSESRIVVVETNDFVRLGLESFLAQQPEWTLAGSTTDLDEALDLCAARQADLLLVDSNALSQEELRPVEVVRAIKSDRNQTRIVFWTDQETPEFMADILLSDADGYLSRDVSFQELLVSLQQIQRGRKLLSCHLPLSRLAPYLHPRPVERKPVFALLTRRERQVLKLLSQGRTNSVIAHELNIKMSTASVHVSNIIAKLKADNRTHAVLLAAELGLASFPSLDV